MVFINKAGARMLLKKLFLISITFSIISQEILAVRPEDLEQLRKNKTCIRGDLSESVLEDSDLEGGVKIRGTSLRGTDLRACGVPDHLDVYDSDFRDAKWAEGQFEALCKKYPCFGVTGRIRSLSVGGRIINVEHMEAYRARLEESQPAENAFTMAYLLDMGDGAQQQEARSLYAKAYELGNKEAANNLGFMSEVGVGGDRSVSNAMVFYQKALPHPVAQMNLTRLMATELGLREEAFSLGKLYEKYGGRDELKSDLRLSHKWYKQAATLGSVEAIRKMLVLSNSSQDWVKKLSKVGLAEHLYVQAQDFLMGKGLSEGYQNTEQSMALLRKAAEADEAKAAFELSAYLKEGKLIARNHEESLTFLKKAVQFGHSQAMINLAGYYQRGYYVNGQLLLKQNREKSLLLYQCALEKSAILPEKEQGTIYRQVARTLGYAYEVGYGVNKDREKALEFYRFTIKAASKSLTSLLGLSRILKAQGKFADSFKYLQEAQAIQEGDMRVLYMMGQHHEKKWNKNLKFMKARDYYEKAAELGHISAKIKLNLWDRRKGRRGDNASHFEEKLIQDIEGLSLKVRAAFEKSLERVSQELKADHRIVDTSGTVLYKYLMIMNQPKK